MWGPPDAAECEAASKADVERPRELATMLDYSRQLAGGFPFVRVDWYYIEDEIIFGEMTLYPFKGTGRFDAGVVRRVLGSYIELPDNGTMAAGS